MTKSTQQQALMPHVIGTIYNHYNLLARHPIESFLQQLWLTWPFVELPEREASDHAHCFYGVWLSLQEAQKNQAPVLLIKTPQIEEEYWACQRTVLHAVWPDSPFLVDTLRITLNKLGVRLHVLNSSVIASDASERAAIPAFAVIYAELGLLSDLEITDLKMALLEAFGELVCVVADYPKLLQQNQQLQAELRAEASPASQAACELLQWLEHSHFTFLGYCEFNLDVHSGAFIQRQAANLGVCRLNTDATDCALIPALCADDVCRVS